MTDKSLQSLVNRLLSHPWVLRFIAKATGMSPSNLTSQIEDAVAAAMDADKLGMGDKILASADAIEARRNRKREIRTKTSASGIPQVMKDDVEFIYGTPYMFEGVFFTLDKYLENKSPEQKLKWNRAIWEELGIKI